MTNPTGDHAVRAADTQPGPAPSARPRPANDLQPLYADGEEQAAPREPVLCSSCLHRMLPTRDWTCTNCGARCYLGFESVKCQCGELRKTQRRGNVLSPKTLCECTLPPKELERIRKQEEDHRRAQEQERAREAELQNAAVRREKADACFVLMTRKFGECSQPRNKFPICGDCARWNRPKTKPQPTKEPEPDA